MIIWGSGGGQETLGDLGEHECGACEKKSGFTAILNYTYRHIWYLLSFVSKREYYAVCDNCNNAVPIDKAEAKKMFPKDQIPFIRKNGWVLGAVALAVFLVVMVIGSNAKNKKNEEYLASPMVNDLYLADLAKVPNSGYDERDDVKNAYGIMKLIKVTDEGVDFVASTKANDKKSGLRKALRSSKETIKYDMSDVLQFSREDIRALYDKSVIYEIRRPGAAQ